MRSGDGLMLGEVEADRPHPHAHIFISLQFGPSFAAFVEANEIITMSWIFTMSSLLSVFCFGANIGVVGLVAGAFVYSPRSLKPGVGFGVGVTEGVDGGVGAVWMVWDGGLAVTKVELGFRGFKRFIIGAPPTMSPSPHRALVAPSVPPSRQPRNPNLTATTPVSHHGGAASSHHPPATMPRHRRRSTLSSTGGARVIRRSYLDLVEVVGCG
jgi:hypothetical protein